MPGAGLAEVRQDKLDRPPNLLQAVATRILLAMLHTSENTLAAGRCIECYGKCDPAQLGLDWKRERILFTQFHNGKLLCAA